MKDADALHRTHSLTRGYAELQRLGLRIGETVPEKSCIGARAALSIDRSTAGSRRAARAIARASCSIASSKGEEDHADWIETQLFELLRQIGEAHYLEQQVRS